jgi:hypothetical protein
LLGTLVATGDTKPALPNSINSTLELRLVEEGVNGDGIAESLRGMLGHLTGWVFPRAFICYAKALDKTTQ